ncbi:MAG: hypothetical protein HYX20_02060 [Candidatus Yanofskybacteria bacterium]|nr:hypothetical protein [Candidatus Yanofskybacteria bacterium]
MNKKRLVALFIFFAAINPTPASAQLYRNPMPTLFGVILNNKRPFDMPPAAELVYGLGANYHSTTSNFVTKPGYFIRYYHETETRMKVLEQLQEMADSGANTVKTFIFPVDDPVNPMLDTVEKEEAWWLAFPLSGQELDNVIRYATDVASVKAADGHYLDLEFSFGWLGCADYKRDNPNGTYGLCNMSWEEFASRAKESVSNLIYRAGFIRRPDGKKVVKVIYLEGEIMIGANPNQERFLLDIYPYLVSQANSADVTLSVYFIIASSEGEIFDDSFADKQYPAINGHRSLFWMFRSTEFMRANNLPIPGRLDFSFYPTPTNRSYADLIKRVFDDIQIVYGAHQQVGVSETFYLLDEEKRRVLGQAFANEFKLRGMPRQVIFWTTPDGGGQGINVGPPFDFDAYKPLEKPTVNPINLF